MYAIIQTGGKQFKCSQGDVLTVSRLDVQAGEVYSCKDVLLVSDDSRIEVGTPFIKGAEVVCEVLGEKKSKKTIAFRFRRRKDSKRIRGQRQLLTDIKVKEIKF
jgi:large subunit ribosomal protein L21